MHIHRCAFRGSLPPCPRYMQASLGVSMEYYVFIDFSNSMNTVMQQGLVILNTKYGVSKEIFQGHEISSRGIMDAMFLLMNLRGRKLIQSKSCAT